MARIAFVKLFTGLNLGVSQLSGELQRAGHDSLIIYFKDFLVVPGRADDRTGDRLRAHRSGGARAPRSMDWNCYTPFTEREYELLIDALREFRPDLIGFSL